MMTLIHRHRWAAACSAVAVLGVSALVVPVIADDMMAKDGMMMHDPMMMMKDGMKDDASKMQMTSDLAKMMVMQHLAMQMCENGKCQKAIDADPDLMKMQSEAMKMAKNPEQMKMLAEQLKKDPMAMRQVMMMAMARSGMTPGGVTGGMKDDKMMHDGKTTGDDKMMKH